MLAIYIQGIEGSRGERPFTPQRNDGQRGGGALKKGGRGTELCLPSILQSVSYDSGAVQGSTFAGPSLYNS